jgi:uncharacterized protein YecE (DUF72 family)
VEAYDPTAELRALVDAYDFREVHPNLRVGSASDRYGGWLDQIYPAERWEAEVKTRPKKIGGKTFEERVLPVASVQDYFEHFGVLELDFTYYRPLLGPDGEPSPNYRVLAEYAEQAPAEALFLLKAPQQVFTPRLRRSSGGQVSWEDNPDYLNAEAYDRDFQQPALELLQDRLIGVVFEQSYQRAADSPDPKAFVGALDRFFESVPPDVQPHLEVRSPHLLTPPYFDWLADRGLGHVFSHWTWLPPIREQWEMSGSRMTASDSNVVTRLLTPLRISYADAYAKAHPFDKPVPELEAFEGTRKMILDAVALTYQAESRDAVHNLILNNRAYGNSPELGRRIAHRILDEEAKRLG